MFSGDWLESQVALSPVPPARWSTSLFPQHRRGLGCAHPVTPSLSSEGVFEKAPRAENPCRRALQYFPEAVLLVCSV